MAPGVEPVLVSGWSRTGIPSHVGCICVVREGGVDEIEVEGHPDDDQKNRLEDFLSELMLLVRRYRILPLDPDAELRLLDMVSGNLIGLGLVVFTAPGNDHLVTGLLPADSILDGDWLMDGPTGAVEQRHVQNVFPLRDRDEGLVAASTRPRQE